MKIWCISKPDISGTIWNLEKLHISFEYHTVFKPVNCCDL